jgi:hypothetical protein
MHLVPILVLVLGAALASENPFPGPVPPGGGNAIQKTALAAKTAAADLLPPAPRRQATTVNPFKVDLNKVPEVDFQEPLRNQEPPSHAMAKDDATRAIAGQLAKMRQLNDRKTDAFHELLIAQRRDLQGLPFVLGNACRTTGNRANLFGIAALFVRQKLLAGDAERLGFWEAFETELKKAKQEHMPQLKAMVEGNFKAMKDKTELKPLNDQERQALEQELDAACVAALMQILAPEPVGMRQGLVQFLAKIPHADATQALARLALFSAEEEVRRPALEALKSRPKQDYQAIVMQGFRYPLPEVAERAALAAAALKLQDLVPQLVSLLDEPDPRLPTAKTVDGKKVWVVREVVRINHHRNCMLCHAPAAPLEPQDNLDSANALKQQFQALFTMAPVPLPCEPLPPPSEGYNPSRGNSDLLVRIDTTYLRQDFSLMQEVANATPWPKLQRFDFFVRSRVVTSEEAERYRKQAPQPRADVGDLLAGATAGTLWSQAPEPQADAGNPYRQAVASALCELTGKQAGANARGWRNLLTRP